MACIFNIKTDFLPDVTGGGEWELIGFSLTEGGTYGSGGNWPWSNIAEEDPQVDFDTIIQGYYKLNYFVEDPCGGSQEIIVPVVGNGDAGVTASLDACTSGSIIDIASELGATYEGGVLEPMFSYSGNGVSSGGFNQPNPNTPIGATFDPSLVSAGTYTITLNITPQAPVGYTLDNCCPPTSAALIITVAEGSITIDITDCYISLVSSDGCDTATFELHKSTDGGTNYVATGITALPYQAQEDALWKWVGTGCDCGTVESNVVDSTGCCTDSDVTIFFDIDFCSIGVVGSGGCAIGGWNGSYVWYRSCDGGVTWEHQAVHDGNDFIIVNDDCQWQLTVECINGCKSYSNIVTAACGGSCTGNIAGQQLTCVYRAASGLFCDGGSLKLVKVGTGVVATEILSAGNTYPIDFPITSDGDYYASLDCGDGCPDRIGPTFTYTNCGTPPPTCNSVLTAQVISCAINASVTNCPSPTYTFLDPDDNIIYSGPNNTLAVSINGTWTVRADGCPDCPQLETTVVVSGCDTSCNCVASISEDPCAIFTLTPQACSGYSIQWEFSSDGGSNWNNVGSGGLTYTGTQNGRYRAVLTKDGCPDVVTNEIDITCFSSGCDCTPTISVDVNDCEIDWSIVNCVGFTATMQRQDSGSWIDVQANPSNPYAPPQNGVYRLKFEKAGCNTIYSDPVNVTCVGGFCQIVITSIEINPLDCSEVTINWTGAGGSNVTVQWTKATANTSSCDNASGWAICSGAFTTQQNNDGTGSSTITLDPEDCDTCIRPLVDATAEGCGIDIAKIFAPCCCEDTPTISKVAENVNYAINVYDETDTIDKYDTEAVVDSSGPRITGSTKVTRNGSVVESTPFDIHLTDIDLRRNIQANNSDPDYNIGAFVVSVRFAKASDDSVFDILLGPTTAILSGSGGTITGSDLIYNGNSADLVNAITIAINNFLGALALYSDLVVSWGPNGINIGTSCHHNATDNYSGIKGTDARFVWQQDNGDQYVTTSAGGNNNGASRIFNSTYAPCGTLSTRLVVSPSNLSIVNSTHNFVSVAISNPDAEYNNDNQTTNLTCVEYTLTVEGECSPGASYLWSTGATTEQIIVTQNGEYSVVVTCPDGCEYTLNITV